MWSVLALLFAPGASAQSGFVVPLKTVAGDAEVTLIDGSLLRGKVSGAASFNGAVRKLKLKTEDGTKHKLRAEDVLQMELFPGGFAKLMGTAAASSSVIEASRSHSGSAMKITSVRFDQHELLDGKISLLQRINPDHDHLLQVYVNPKAGKTLRASIGGVPVAGGADRSYLVMKDGGDYLLKVTKTNYSSLAHGLYDGCATYEVSTDLGFFQFADHVRAFDQACAVRGPMPQDGPVSSLPPTR